MGSWLKGAWEPKFSVPSLQLPLHAKLFQIKQKLAITLVGKTNKERWLPTKVNPACLFLLLGLLSFLSLPAKALGRLFESLE